jgi:hypothetical protein
MAIDSLADILTIVITASIAIGGAIGAGYKLKKRRVHWPKANVSQEVQAIRLTDDEICIHTCARIQNIGDVMISICSAKHTIYWVLPLDPSIQGWLKRERKSYYDDLNKEIGEQINWPGYSKEVGYEIEIEPGEYDKVHFDWVIPANIEIVGMYTYFQNLKKRGPIGWHTKQFYEVSKLLLGG